MTNSALTKLTYHRHLYNRKRNSVQFVRPTANVSPLLSLSSFPFFVLLTLFKSIFFSPKFLAPVLMFKVLSSLRGVDTQWPLWTLPFKYIYYIHYIHTLKFQLRLVSESLVFLTQKTDIVVISNIRAWEQTSRSTDNQTGGLLQPSHMCAEG